MTTSPMYTPPTTEIRGFPPSALHDSVARALSAVPRDHTVAFVAGAYGDRESATLSVAVKINDRWSFSGDLQHRWNGDTKGQVLVAYSR